jgi:hypothetical protein
MSKKKLTKEEKAAKAKRKSEWMTIFIGGKQKSVRRPIMVDGLDPETFLERNASPIWLLEEGRYEILDLPVGPKVTRGSTYDDEIPF